jgi:transcription elongation factor Elf1
MVDASENFNPKMICPHCRTRESVRTEQVMAKVGISGGKAAAAVLTSGLSRLFVGLSRKEERTNCVCGNCGNRWQF